MRKIHIEQRPPSSFRARVMVSRRRFCRTFKSYGEAENWAKAIRAEHQIKVGGPLLSERQIKELPREFPICGVYFLFKGEDIVYVGQSRNVYQRVTKHRRILGAQYDSFSIIRCEESKLDFLESYYISKLNPPLNVRKVIFERDQAIRGSVSHFLRDELPDFVPNVGAEGGTPR